MEDKYFAGEKVAYRPGQSKTVYDYVKGSCDRNTAASMH
jgi:hypothetical protein